MTSSTQRFGTRLGAAAATLLLAVSLQACGSPQTTPAPAVGETSAAFPRTIEVPAGRSGEPTELTIDEEPRRVAALTYETAELVASLGAGDRLVMVPEAVTNPALTNHAEVMAAVETKAATESTTHAEAVIATDPELVLLSARHGLETGVGEVLTDAGFPVLVLPNSWGTVEDMVLNVDLVGSALGLDDEADALAADLESGLSPRADSSSARPSVLVLGNQAGRPMVTAGSAFPLEILRLAGAEDASETLGFAHSGPITVEQVIETDPDAILLIDMNGTGERLFAPIMDNPAVVTLPAVAEERVLLVEGRQVQALGIEHTVEGLDAIAAWLAEG